MAGRTAFTSAMLLGAALGAGSLGAALLATADAGGAGAIRGTAVATDGDTLAIGSVRIRLHGVDAPESDQSCGDAAGRGWDCGGAARDRLAALIADREVRCAAQDHDRYGRVVAICAAGGTDLGATLVAEGLARAYVRYSEDYVAAEDTARRDHRGLWQGASLAPWDYRNAGFVAAAGAADPEPALAPEPAAPDPAAPGGCAIKGNVTTGGERVYHGPDSPWYGRTRIEPARGERWFCDAAAAEAAGWRAAGQ